MLIYSITRLPNSIRTAFVGAAIFGSAGTLLFSAQAAQVSHKRRTFASSSASSTQLDFKKNVTSVINKYCVNCHTGAGAASGVTLDKDKTAAAVIKDRETWDRVIENVGSGHMPPMGVPHPSAAERDRLTTYLQTTLSRADCDIRNPGRVTLRRLNREEYNNTIRDLFDISLRPADEFPSDDVGYGFDNIGDVLSMSPLLMEKYLNAAEKISKAVIVLADAAPMGKHFQAAQASQSAGSGQVYGDGYRIFLTNGELGTDIDFPQEGEYELRARAFQQRAGKEPARMSFRIDGKEIKGLDVSAGAYGPAPYFVRTPVAAGKHRFAIAFLNEFSETVPADPKNKFSKPELRKRSLIVESFDVGGPYGVKALPSAIQRRLVVATPTATTPEAWTTAARAVLKPFATRAYRRPVAPAELDRLVKCVLLAQANGETFESGLQLALQAVLVSPNFLFRAEVDTCAPGAKGERLITPYEMASRLSYFIWSSMPDQELMSTAANGELLKPVVLAKQVRRMLRDPKAKALADNFAGQWLMLRSLNNVSPNSDQFPMFNDTLRKSMRTETEMFFNEIVHDDRSVLDFIDGKFTYLNEPLAKHYGISGVTGDDFHRVALTGDERGGILTQASILTVTSNPTRTSPVKRGKWVLENLLGTPPPPPPPNVPELDKKDGQLKGSLRQRMEEHRKNPACASCHARMDPLGFGLENFDAVGRWRTKDGDFAVDSSGVLPGGKSFKGPAQLKEILKGKKDQFVHCLSEKLLTYALGRGLESYDRCTVDSIVKSVSKDNFRFSALVSSVVESDPFRKRTGEGDIR